MKREVVQLKSAEVWVQSSITYSLAVLLAIFLVPAIYGQAKTGGRPRPKTTLVKTQKPQNESEAFNAAWTLRDSDARIVALKAFLTDFPASSKKAAAQEYLAAALSESAS